MSYAGFCEKCGVPYYESDRLAHEHKTAEPAVVSASPEREWLNKHRHEFLTGEEVYPYGHSKEKIEYLDEAAMLKAYLAAAQPVAQSSLGHESSEAGATVEVRVVCPEQAPDMHTVFLNGKKVMHFEYERDADELADSIREALAVAPVSSNGPEPPQDCASFPHYYCEGINCTWISHSKQHERRCPKCGCRVWKEGSTTLAHKPRPDCLLCHANQAADEERKQMCECGESLHEHGPNNRCPKRNGAFVSRWQRGEAK